jgi:hypothetical protein
MGEISFGARGSCSGPLATTAKATAPTASTATTATTGTAATTASASAAAGQFVPAATAKATLALALVLLAGVVLAALAPAGRNLYRGIAAAPRATVQSCGRLVGPSAAGTTRPAFRQLFDLEDPLVVSGLSVVFTDALIRVAGADPDNRLGAEHDIPFGTLETFVGVEPHAIPIVAEKIARLAEDIIQATVLAAGLARTATAAPVSSPATAVEATAAAAGESAAATAAAGESAASTAATGKSAATATALTGSATGLMGSAAGLMGLLFTGKARLPEGGRLTEVGCHVGTVKEGGTEGRTLSAVRLPMRFELSLRRALPRAPCSRL